MHNVEKLAAVRSLTRSVRGIMRMSRFMRRRFSAAEIEHLITWRTRYRAQTDRLDVSAEEVRLQFARWLVEHGRLGEEVAAEPAADRDRDGEPLCDAPQRDNRTIPAKYLPPRCRDFYPRRKADAWNECGCYGPADVASPTVETRKL